MKIKVLMISLMIFVLLVGIASAATHIPAGSVSSYNMNVANETYILDGDVTATGTAFIAGANNVTLDGAGHNVTYGTSTAGFGFDSNSKNNITVKNTNIISTVSRSSTHGIFVQHSMNASVINSTFVSPGSNGIYFYYSNNSIVDGCYVNSNCTNGFYANNMDWVKVSNSSINQIILLYPATNNVFEETTFVNMNIENSSVNNIIRDCDATYIKIRALAAYNTIENCTFTKPTATSPILMYGYNNTILNCTVYADSIPAVDVTTNSAHDNLIVGCNASSNTSYGVCLENSMSTMVEDCNISSNDSCGAKLSNTTNNEISKCTFFTKSTDSADIGVSLESTSNNNKLSNLTISSESRGCMIDTKSTYNTIRDSKIHARLAGVVITRGSNYTLISNCSIVSTTERSIQSYDSRYNNFSSDNTLISSVDSTPHSKNHILLIGDSITIGGGDCGNTYGAWGTTLNQTLNTESGESWYISNQGYGGENTTQMIWRINSILNLYQPGYVFIMAGTNDFAQNGTVESITANDIQLAETVEAFGATPILLAITPSGLYDELRVPINTNLKNSGFYFIDT